MATDLDVLIRRGRAALSACDWTAARHAFAQVVAADDGRWEAVDRLGEALYWLGDYPAALAHRERAYTLARRAGDHRGAAMIAVRLAMLHGLIYGNATAVGGWLAHAHRNLERCDDCPERGWVDVFAACTTPDPAQRARHADAAVGCGRRHADPNLEFDALAYLGKARVELGDVGAGMALIDEAVAAVSGGVVDDAWAAGEIYCTLFHACELTIDARRAEDWMAAVDRYVERTGELPISGICRMHYGGLLTAAGRWDDAERELRAATEVYDGGYTGSRAAPVLGLADLRARQGRVEEARRLVAGLEAHDASVLPRARIHLAEGDAELALALLERHLEARERGIADVPALALAVRVALVADRSDVARRCAGRLGDLADATGVDPLVGLAALAQARIARADGAPEVAGLCARAVDAFAAAGLPYELARARYEHALALADAQPTLARAEARAARAAFTAGGATRDADAADQLLRRLGDRSRPTPRRTGVLTPRETEVLGLLGEGLSNTAIAARLFISPRTAEHHVGNILAKLGLRNRAEAAAHAVRHR